MRTGIMTDNHRPIERPIELPDDDPLPGSGGMFDLPDDVGPPTSPALPGPFFEMPPDDGPPPSAVAAAEVLPPENPMIRELMITPDVEVYLAMLEATIAPYEATAKAFAEEMATAPIDTPAQLQRLGQQSLVAKEREKLLDELFEPAIRKPRQYLDRVYALKRRVLQWVKTGGETAARRYSDRKRALEEADRKARAEADRRQREAQRQAEEAAAAERRRLAQAAAQAAQAGHPAAAATLIEQARAVEAAPVPVEPLPPDRAAAAAVAGLSEREGWTGEISDMYDALLAAARPHLYREVAGLIETGELTPGGGASLTTRLIADRLKALASELPMIPSTMFDGNAAELKTRANADRDTLRWPGFVFKHVFTPVRRTGRK